MLKYKDEFYNKYSRFLDYYNKAERLYQENEIEDCLVNCRRCLEGILQSFCKECGIDFTAMTIENMIDTLKEKEIFTRDEIGVLHRARQLGNKGSHIGNDVPSKNDADLALSELEKAIIIFEEKYNKTYFERIKTAENVPMRNPDYFSVNRKYRGKFAYVFDINQLKIDDDYRFLYAKAENGDIQAMLDLAISFLPREFRGQYAINDNQLFNIPIGYNNDNQVYAYDTRYYYWIQRAAQQAVYYFENRRMEKIPMKYISTALFEALLYTFLYRYSNCYLAMTRIEKNNTPVYFNQYDMIRNWYGDCAFCNIIKTSQLLLFLIEQYGIEIIDQMFNQKHINDIKYFDYCLSYINNSINKNTELIKIVDWFAINPSEIGKTANTNMLKGYSTCSPSNAMIYNCTSRFINMNKQKKAEVIKDVIKYCFLALLPTGLVGVHDFVYASKSSNKMMKTISYILGFIKIYIALSCISNLLFIIVPQTEVKVEVGLWISLIIIQLLNIFNVISYIKSNEPFPVFNKKK